MLFTATPLLHGPNARFLVLLPLLSLAYVVASDVDVLSTRGRSLHTLSAEHLHAELTSQTESCVVPNNCPNPWYYTTVGDDMTNCSYTADQFTEGLYVIGGHPTFYPNSSNDKWNVGSRSGEHFALNYQVQHRCKYHVCLAFRELYWKEEGKRIFDVVVEGQTIFKDLDLFQKTHKRVTPFVHCFDVDVEDRMLSFEFISSKDFATVSEVSICAVECKQYREDNPLPPPPNSDANCRILPTPPTTFISAVAQMNAGGEAMCGFDADLQVPAGSPDIWVQLNGTSAARQGRPGSVVKDVLQTYRSGSRGAAFSYTWPVDAGYEYFIRLTFSEQFYTISADRIFSVLANDVVIGNALDVFALSDFRGFNETYVLRYTWQAPCTEVDTLTLKFVSIANDAIVNAIEVYKVKVAENCLRPTPEACPTVPVAPRTYMYPVVLMNAGGPAICGFTADGDTPAVPSVGLYLNHYGLSDRSTAATANDYLEDVLQTYRWGKDFGYEFPAFGGYEYKLRLTFAEPIYHAAGERIFSVLLHGETIAADIDLVERVGFNKPYVLEYTWQAPVSVGVAEAVQLRFVASRSEALVNAIEIYKIGRIESVRRRLSGQSNGTWVQPDVARMIGRKAMGHSLLQLSACDRTPYDYGNDRKRELANKQCWDLVPEHEVVRGMGAERIECTISKSGVVASWGSNDLLAYPCCRQCRWDTSGTSIAAAVYTNSDLPVCDACVQQRLQQKFRDLPSKLARRTALSNPKCPTEVPGTGATWLFSDVTRKCYMVANDQVKRDLRGTNYQAMMQRCMDLSENRGGLLHLENQAEEDWVIRHLTFTNGAQVAEPTIGARRRKDPNNSNSNVPWYWEPTDNVNTTLGGMYVNGGRGRTAFNPSDPNPTPGVPQCLRYTMQDPENDNRKRWIPATCQANYFICKSNLKP